MKLKLVRQYKKDTYTIGSLYVNGVWFSSTLEDKDRGLDSSWKEEAIKKVKIAGSTAIPTGTYDVVLSVSPKFKNKSWAKKYKGLVPEILGVKGFSGTRMHPGNTVEDTDGCPLIGENKVKGGLVNSQKTYFKLMDKHLMPAWESEEKISIEIV